MKSGVRALGIAESTRGERSDLAGVVVRADRAVDGVVFGSCTVGGTDLTAAVIDCYRRLDREDIRYVFIAGIALAWYNLLDLRAVAEMIDRPVLSVSFESSEGLESTLEDQFSGAELDDRLEAYRAQPPRERLDVNDTDIYVRSIGFRADDTGTAGATRTGAQADDVSSVVRAFTPEGGRPEPVRVARLVARAASDGRQSHRNRGGYEPERS